MSRTKKSAINSVVGITCSLISSILSFVLQATFIRLLGLEYSGINGLFTDILKILNLAELGISNAIMFRLYKQIAENNMQGIEKILSYYRKLSYFIGFIILGAGLCFVPFLHFFVKETPTFPESLWSLYIIVLSTSVFTQFFSYKSILILAKQDRYIYTIVNYSTIFLKHGLQILVLWLFKNIYLYLIVALFTTIISGIIIGMISRRRYSHSFVSKETLSKNEKKNLLKDVGSLSIYKLCRTLDATIDTFLISKFVSVSTTAIYASVNMLLGALNELLGCINDGIIASIGDVYASGDKLRTKQIFYQSLHLTYLIYGICTATLFPLLSLFTNWWIGHTLDDIQIYFMLINFYIYGFGMTVATFRNSMGVFQKGWIRPAVTAALNFIVSFILVQEIGLVGTLIGTLISRTLTLVWYDPYIIFKHAFGEFPAKYYVRYFIYAVFTATACGINLFLNSIIPFNNNIVWIFIHGICYLVVSAVLLFAFGLLFREQNEVIMRFKGLFFRKKHKEVFL